MQKMILFWLVLLYLGCSPSQTTPTLTSTEIPQLLDRAPGIQNGLEWDRIQNKYAALKQAINQKEELQKSKLELAQLFTLEARVTGEHGHYYPAAKQVLQEILEDTTTPKEIRFMALTTLAGVQLSLHEFSTALQTGRDAYALNPYNAQIHGVLVDAMVELGKYEEAVKVADQMVAIRPDIRSYARVSYLREIHGLPKEAIEAMQLAAMAGAPGSEEKAWALYQLGKMCQRYNEPKQAEEVFQYIMEERPEYPFAIAALADLAADKGDYEQAEALLKKACGIIPEVSFYESLALLYQKTARQEEAQQLVPEILAMLKDDEENGHRMNLEYAAVHEQLRQDYDQALHYLMEAYQERPDNIEVNQRLAELYLKQGHPEQAKPYIEKAQRTNSKNPAIVAL
ncbi:MAG: tetratricopeptide repeat protein [Phaeodactylibacter sp.]|nr:tetratricopeptide repeat protein [Phaeodactylibacter sp.]